MKLKKFMRKAHKWLGLIIGLQVLFWVAGGLIMSSFPIERVHGDHLRKGVVVKPLPVEQLFPIETIIKSAALPVIEILTKPGFSGPQYQLRDSEGQLHFYDAITGTKIPEINGYIAQQH